MVLLLSAQKKYEEAMTLIKAGLEEYPDNLRYVKLTLGFLTQKSCWDRYLRLCPNSK